MTNLREMTDVDREISRRVAWYRKAAKLTQTQLAQKIETTYQQVQKYEQGRNRITCGRIVQIARALEVDVGRFFEGLPV